MKPTQLTRKLSLLVVTGIVAAILGAWAGNVLNRRNRQAAPPLPETVTILVAKQDLKAGDALERAEQLFEKKEFPKGTEPRNAITDIEIVNRRVMKRDVRTGDCITTADMLDERHKRVLGRPVIPTGHRCVGIKVTKEELHMFGVGAWPSVDLVEIAKEDNDAVPSQSCSPTSSLLQPTLSSIATGKVCPVGTRS